MENGDTQTPVTPAPRKLGRTLWWFAAIFFVAVLLYGAGPGLVASWRAAETGILKVGAAAPDFRLTLFGGEPASLSGMKGSVVVVNFWASWCGPCKEEAPALERLWQAYRDRGVRFVGIAVSDTEKDSLAFIKAFGLTYPNGPDPSDVGRAYRLTGVPETYVVGKDGRLARRIIGPIQEDALASDLEKLLAE